MVTMMSVHRIARGPWVSALLGAAMITGCGKAPAMGGFPPPQVTVVTVRPETVPESFEFPGEVTPYRRVDVRARVDGIIIAREFNEGAIVASGQLLYRLDQVRYDAAYRGAQARAQNAKQNFDRVEPLLARHAVAEHDVDDARAQMAAAQAALDQAKKDLDDTEVRAEIAGRVGRALLEVGARVTGPSDLLTSIDRLDPVYVTFRPSSEQLLEWQRSASARALLRPGSPLHVQVILPDGALLPREGRLDFLAPSLDAATGTRELRADFQNGDRLLRPGQFVRVRLVGVARDSALAIPQRAVQSGLGRQFVYVVGRGDTVSARDVQPGRWSGDRWIITAGLNPGDRVIVDGVQKVAPGRPVMPMPLADSAATLGADK